MNIGIHPVNMITDRRESSVILAILDNKTSDAMLLPCSVALSAYIWATAVSSAGVDQALSAVACADHIVPVEAVGGGYHWQHGLLENVRG